ncbi:glycosyltransferase family 1 protein [Dentipellis sp. KUC8613]|nr:glycosyltransferase family 1 protein [Dentipellis sp. KUC8613]
MFTEALVVVFALVLVRIYSVSCPRKILRPRTSATCSLAVFLGSGGHTSEALSLVSALDFTRYTPRTYIVSSGDSLSVQKALALEVLKASTASGSAGSPESVNYRVLTIPRARYVHQKLRTTPWTAFRSLLVSIYHITLVPLLPVSSTRPAVPEALLLNGPGTCFVLCLAVYLNRLLGLSSPRLIYVESFARVKSLSLSGKLLRSIVDSFVVQWPDLLQHKKNGVCHGWLV